MDNYSLFPIGENNARIRIVGVGGAGGNAIRRIHAAGIQHIESIAMNTDAQALKLVQSAKQVVLGQRFTRGMGAGGDPMLGARAAEESSGIIAEALGGADLIFLTFGLGGGTGTGAGPVIARIARRLGILVVGIVTLPFRFEGNKRGKIAQMGLTNLQDQVDTLITIPNDRLFHTATPDITLNNAFLLADDVLRQAVSGISDLVTMPGLINLDFADLRSVMTNGGTSLMSIGEAEGFDRAHVAVKLALENPLLNLRVQGARGVIFNVTGGEDLTLNEVQTIADTIGNAVHPDATMIFGTVTDESYRGKIRVTVIATGLDVLVPVSSQPVHDDPLQTVISTPTRPIGEEEHAVVATRLPIGLPAAKTVPSFLHEEDDPFSRSLIGVSQASHDRSATEHVAVTAERRAITQLSPSEKQNESILTPAYLRRLWG